MCFLLVLALSYCPPLNNTRLRKEVANGCSFQIRPMKYFMLMLAARMCFPADGQELLPDASQDSAANRWLNKKVIASRVLDDMESPVHWTAFSTGAPEVVDARGAQKTNEPGHSAAEISFSRE